MHPIEEKLQLVYQSLRLAQCESFVEQGLRTVKSVARQTDRFGFRIDSVTKRAHGVGELGATDTLPVARRPSSGNNCLRAGTRDLAEVLYLDAAAADRVCRHRAYTVARRHDRTAGVVRVRCRRPARISCPLQRQYSPWAGSLIDIVKTQPVVLSTWRTVTRLIAALRQTFSRSMSTKRSVNRGTNQRTRPCGGSEQTKSTWRVGHCRSLAGARVSPWRKVSPQGGLRFRSGRVCGHSHWAARERIGDLFVKPSGSIVALVSDQQRMGVLDLAGVGRTG